MTESTKKSTNQSLMDKLEAIEKDLLIPELYQVNRWNLNSFGDKQSGINVTYLYVRNPQPLFNLNALYQCFKHYLKSININPNSRVMVGGQLHKYDKKKEILSLSSFKINPSFLDQKYKSNCKHVSAKKLTLRLKEKGFTLIVWTRGCSLYLFKNHSLKERPWVFIRKFVRELEYPQFLVKDWLSKKGLKEFIWWYNTVRDMKYGHFNFQI
jgi:hypothetical protein